MVTGITNNEIFQILINLTQLFTLHNVMGKEHASMNLFINTIRLRYNLYKDQNTHSNQHALDLTTRPKQPKTGHNKNKGPYNNE